MWTEIRGVNRSSREGESQTGDWMSTQWKIVRIRNRLQSDRHSSSLKIRENRKEETERHQADTKDLTSSS